MLHFEYRLQPDDTGVYFSYQAVDTLPSNPERTVALRKLLEAKDCAVRALLFKE